MLISEAIQELTKRLAEHGDIPIRIHVDWDDFLLKTDDFLYDNGMNAGVQRCEPYLCIVVDCDANTDCH